MLLIEPEKALEGVKVISSVKARVILIGTFPASGPLGVKVVSIEFLLEATDIPLVLRGHLNRKMIRQSLKDAVRGRTGLTHY